MDYDTVILFILLVAAFLWWFKLAFEENRSLVREFEQKKKEAQLREEKVRRLVKRR